MLLFVSLCFRKANSCNLDFTELVLDYMSDIKGDLPVNNYVSCFLLTVFPVYLYLYRI